ncbi:hypothetical protein ABT116_27660 [Streptomyces sp. NPDC002130]|uniref:hypothetical protein n=1 Tax=Streptomyces sp. NPDC002130 TaxID=3155568 RepID=UPI00331D70A7
MLDKVARGRAMTVGRSAGLIATSLAWATLITVSPWLPSTVGILDLTGVAAVLSMLILGPVPSFLLGTLLGRARATWLVATCGAAGPSLWILDFTVFSDPDVRSSTAVAVASAGALALGLVSAPLLAGAAAGRFCCRSGTAGRLEARGPAR